jgi:hypothetical protein
MRSATTITDARDYPLSDAMRSATTVTDARDYPLSDAMPSTTTITDTRDYPLSDTMRSATTVTDTRDYTLSDAIRSTTTITNAGGIPFRHFRYSAFGTPDHMALDFTEPTIPAPRLITQRCSRRKDDGK